MQKIVVIVAGGKGIRMETELPKQFLKLNNYPILLHTIEKFKTYDKNISIRLVLPKEHRQIWEHICTEYQFNGKIEIYNGGGNRFESVTNGIQNLPENALVAIHDGVRPLVNHKTIDACFSAAQQHGAAIPVIPPLESLREIIGENSKPVDRSQYVLVQTPQVFKAKILVNAYKTKFSELFTDDATVVEQAGHKIFLVDGHRENIKITTPIDLKFAEALIEK